VEGEEPRSRRTGQKQNTKGGSGWNPNPNFHRQMAKIDTIFEHQSGFRALKSQRTVTMRSHRYKDSQILGYMAT